MSPLWKKEIRLMWPAWLLALAAPLAALTIGIPGREEWAFFLAVLGCGLLGGSSFGPELSHGMMDMLLVQPCERRRVWRLKMIVLACALAPFLGGMIFAHWHWPHGPPLGLYCFIPLCAFCAAPALTLRARNGLAGGLLAFVFPAVLCTLAVAVVSRFYTVPLDGSDEGLARVLGWVCFGLLSAFCATLGWLGRWMFLHYESVHSTILDLPVGRWLEAPFTRLMRGSGRSGAFVALVRKEIRLQHASILLAAFLLLGILVILGVLPWFKPDHRAPVLHVAVGLLAAILPLLMGSMSVAEERNLGVHAWQLMLPVPAWKQWLAKLGVTLGGSCVLGLVLPWLALAVGHLRVPELEDIRPDSLEGAVFPVMTQLLFTLLAMYASTLTGTTLRAVLGGVGLAFAVGLSFQWLAMAGSREGLGGIILKALPGSDAQAQLLERFFLAVMTFWLLLLAALGFGNFKQSHITRRRVWGQVVFLVGAAPLLSLLLPAVLAFIVIVVLHFLRAGAVQA